MRLLCCTWLIVGSLLASSARGAGSLWRLKEGGAAFLAGDYAAARRHLLPLGAGSSLRNQDYALYLLAESEVLLAQQGQRSLYRLALQRFQAVARMTGSRFQNVARGRAADCLFELGRDAEARALYLALLRAPKAEIDMAVVRLHLAEIALRAGRSSEARTELRRLHVEHPLHPLAKEAFRRLQELDEGMRLEAREHITRARAMIQARRWGEAIEELGRVSAHVDQVVRDEVDYWMGTAHYRMRRGYDIAAEKLLTVARRLQGERQAEAMFHGARALSRADRDDEAIAAYGELVRTHPNSRWAAEASLLAGWLEYNRGRYLAAIPLLSQTVRRFSGPHAEEARWYLAFSRYLLGQYEAALADLQVLARRSDAHGDKGRYWLARTLLLLGRRDEGIDLLRRLTRARPLSYYALLSRARLRELGIEVGPFEGNPPPPPPPLGAPDPQLARDPAVARVDELLQAGLPEEAAYELRRVERMLLTRYGVARALPLLLDRYVRGQNYHRSHLLAEVYGARALLYDPHRNPAVRAYWEQIYPLAYRDLVEKHGPSGWNPRRYLYAIMQKESAYNPHDVSYADAIGLLQMIPPTSRRVAAALGRIYSDDLLYDPEANIELGAWYIGRLLRKFRGQIALGAGSYNAGPRAMVRWLRQHGDRPLDEFIELCAYSQTREYMKKVLDIYAHYVYLWDREEYLPALKMDRTFLEDDGIDY
ncbi:MAG: transglycosylase SLT domain-containing protein [Myxococcales bacterium]|nr:transglycosylase SLT domain-containing protein [Myxococcota bacterium]MDW8283715.1 transglycosylase SLT domain-containing protein [Myxococcales bacterium]